MALEIKPTKSYKTDLKKYKNNEKVSSRLKTAIDLLIKGDTLPTDYRDHIYVGGYRKYKNVRDCHILPDCVLLYTKTSDSLILIRLGNHGSIVESLKKLRMKKETTYIKSKPYIFEKLERLGNDMFITDYVGNIVDLVKNKTDTYRILYDSKIDKYIIANSYDYTHFEMLRKAYDEGWYIDVDDYISNVSDGLHNYFHDGVYGDSNDSDRTIVCYLVYPDSGTKWLYQDNYDAGYLLNADNFIFPNEARVVVGIKGNGFKDPQFFMAFGKPRILTKRELME